jgi:hypothetical protein
MADNDGALKLFGFEIRRAKGGDTASKKEKLDSPVPPTDYDGAGYVTAGAGHFGQYINMDGDDSKDNHQLILRYRGVAMHPEVDMAIEEIVNESISASELKSSVTLSLDDVQASDKIKKQIGEEFKNIVSMLKFNENGHDMFRSWYVDGRVYHHLLVNESNLKAGIQEIRHIDSSRIRKVKQIKHKKDPITGAKLVDKIDEYYIFEEKPGTQSTGLKISKDAISYVTSGLLDENKKKVVSHLHKALKPINQLRMMEDSLVIYRLARAPERRIFYIDVGNLPRGKADQYMKDIMTKYRNKLVYDANTGQLKDDRKHMSMLEDFWLPRREGGRGTEISTLPGGENLGQIDDIIYFQKRLYRSLNVPVNRLEQEAQFTLGRSTEISRDEVKFQKFIDRLRRRFSWVFLGILRKQLLLRGIITDQDWEEWKDNIYVDYVIDNHFSELKESEVIRERIATLDQVSQYVGEYFSKEWVMRNVLRMSDDEITNMDKEIAGEEPRDEEQPPATPKQDDSEKTTTTNEEYGEFVEVENVSVPLVMTTEVDPQHFDPDQFYIPSNEDELVETMTRYMSKLVDED